MTPVPQLVKNRMTPCLRTASVAACSVRPAARLAESRRPGTPGGAQGGLRGSRVLRPGVGATCEPQQGTAWQFGVFAMCQGRRSSSGPAVAVRPPTRLPPAVVLAFPHCGAEASGPVGSAAPSPGRGSVGSPPRRLSVPGTASSSRRQVCGAESCCSCLTVAIGAASFLDREVRDGAAADFCVCFVTIRSGRPCSPSSVPPKLPCALGPPRPQAWPPTPRRRPAAPGALGILSSSCTSSLLLLQATLSFHHH